MDAEIKEHESSLTVKVGWAGQALDELQLHLEADVVGRQLHLRHAHENAQPSIAIECIFTGKVF